MGGFEGAGCLDLGWEIIRTPTNPIIVLRCTYFLSHECSDLGMGGWVSQNLNIVGICKSIHIIGRFLTTLVL